MNLRLVIFLIICCFPIAVPAGSVRAEENAGQDPVQTQLRVLQSLNQIAVSLTHIIAYNDKVVLDQEYNSIINNLNLSKIPDAEIITLIQELMDLLTSSKILDHDRTYLAHNYEKNIQNELKKRVRTRIFETDLVLNPYTTVLNAVLNVGSFYFNYRAQIDEYKREREEKSWKIEASTMQGLNSFYKKLLKSSWELMRRYNFPDEWRLNDKQLSDYISILKESDIELRYRKLVRIEGSFQKFPPYWYYRGQSAQEIGKKEEALHCFNQFQEIHQGIFRKDPHAASTAMAKTMLMTAKQATLEQIKSDLEILLANSDDADWGNILFAALQYGRLGDKETAGRLIMRNLDNRYTAFIENPDMIRTVGPALLLNARQDVFDRIMDTVLKNDKIKNYDVLWLYGQIRNQDILRRIEPEFNHVLLLTANKSLLNPLNLFKDDDLTLFLPTRWMADNLAIKLVLTHEKGETDFRPDDIAPMPKFPEITVLTFKNVISIKSHIKKKKSTQIAIALVREKLPTDRTDKNAYEIEMFFNSKVMTAHEHLQRIITYSNYIFTNAAENKTRNSGKSVGTTDLDGKKHAADKKKEDPEDLALWFAKEKILINGETFQWSDNGLMLR